jgi:hypothetical protein
MCIQKIRITFSFLFFPSVPYFWNFPHICTSDDINKTVTVICSDVKNVAESYYLDLYIFIYLFSSFVCR